MKQLHHVASDDSRQHDPDYVFLLLMDSEDI
jgi:hypothetical protein